MSIVITNQEYPTNINPLEKLLLKRHTCRAYQPTEVPREIITRILEAAQRAASDCNIQPWRILIVSGAALNRLREAMYETAAAGVPIAADIPPIDNYFGQFRERKRQCGWALYEAVGIQRGDRIASRVQALENYRFFGAPHLALIMTEHALGTRAVLDCGLYLGTFMLAAEALGVATTPQAAVACRADVIRGQLDVPKAHDILCGVAFGWPDRTHLANSYRTSRVPLGEVADFIDV